MEIRKTGTEEKILEPCFERCIAIFHAETVENIISSGETNISIKQNFVFRNYKEFVKEIFG